MHKVIDMRKLHKKYIFLNVFLIIYIMSLSVGYAYFSESIQVTGTAKTLEYSRMPLVPIVSTSSALVGGHYTAIGDYMSYNRMENPSYDVYEYYYTFDYTTFAEDLDYDFNSRLCLEFFCIISTGKQKT